MASRVLYRSTAFSLIAWIIVCWMLWQAPIPPDNMGVLVCLLFAPLPLGGIVCILAYLFRNSMDKSRIKCSYKWTLAPFDNITSYVFSSVWDKMCPLCLSGAIIYILTHNNLMQYHVPFAFLGNMIQYHITSAIIYVIVCWIVPTPDTGSSLFDMDESERISAFKIFLLSLWLTPIIGYIVTQKCKSEQEQKIAVLNRHLERAKIYLEQKDYTNVILECTDGLEEKAETANQQQVHYEILLVLAEAQCAQKKYEDAIWTYYRAMYTALYPNDADRCVVDVLKLHQWAYEDRSVAVTALQLLDEFERRYPNEIDCTEERTRLRSVIEGNEVAS